MAVPLMACAADMLYAPSRQQVVLVGDKSSSELKKMVAVVYASYNPLRSVIQIDRQNEEDMEFWESNNQNIFHMAKGSPNDKEAVAYVCQNFVCNAPVAEPDALSSLLMRRVS
ncbi:spermatogenesis-associated protein 20 [Dendrobium catenatum]|uniref:spermatogenesis-associated protein 20 n=1 Tax=Dendrobium catenatum TaxID=906689 RepID=UPI0009F4B8C8|nr:spermatogenesis-associated protein 20 [Dendrobium catenatum]